jgi:precorrin-6Y C5,15-methyltransferase (decarboxylating)
MRRREPDLPKVTVVGIGADGWDGLAEPARSALLAAKCVLGGDRQLDLLPKAVTATRIAWPSPLVPALPGLLDEHAESGLVVLASGDPMHFGIGPLIAKHLGAQRLQVLPVPSSISLACARLGWAAQDVTVISAVGRSLDKVRAQLSSAQRILVLAQDGDTLPALTELLRANGYGPSEVVALENLGAATENVHRATAQQWGSTKSEPLAILAVECVAAQGTRELSRTPGLADDAYEHDGQLTKRHVRALTVAALAPKPGQLLWDIGGGAGSVAIEWLRTDRRCRAFAIESAAERAVRIRGNAVRLGVPQLKVVTGRAPEALAGLEKPDAVFIGGGLTVEGMLDAAWDALRPGGTLVANAVTIESERLLVDRQRLFGGDLTKIEIARPASVGGFTAWRSALPVVQFVAVKGEEPR